jgi:hypothetical protein
MQSLPLPVIVFIAVVILILLMALIGYLTGRWEINENLTCSAMTSLA